MRINDFKSVLGSKNCDFALFYNSDQKVSPNMFYFSGYKGVGALVVPANKRPFLVVPEMELERARKSVSKNGFFGLYGMEKKKFFESVYRRVRDGRLRQRKVAIDKNNFTLNSYRYFKKQFKKIKATDISESCLNLRQTKTEKEIAFLAKSCSYADKILQKAISNFGDFKTESEAAAFLEYETRKIGLELSFSPIVASGKNASMPHHEPSNAKISKGFCVLDFGVKYMGYCSDITRTIYVGNPSKKEKEIYGFLLKMQEETINKIEANIRCSELCDYVNTSLGKYKNNFTHGLGHGVGVEIHELPNLTLNSKARIKDNMVFTIEPGIYFPGKFGIRIEDTVMFRGKTQVLTKTDKTLIAVQENL